MAQSLGGSIEVFGWGFGGKESYCVAVLPDDAAGHAVALAASAAGEVTVTRLLDAAEVDEAIARNVAFRMPGS